MRAEERKEHEREIYDGKRNVERPQYHAYWDPELFRELHAHEFDVELEEQHSEHLRGKRVLILGAGRKEVEQALRYTNRVDALNISERAIEDLRTRFPHVHSFVGDAEQLRLDQRYDAVVCRSILHHLHPIEDVLRQIHGVLEPGGVLLVAAEPGLLNPFAAIARTIAPSQQHTPGERPFIFSRFRRQISEHFTPLYENQYFVVSMLFPYVSRKSPVLAKLSRLLLKPTLTLERYLRAAPAARDLYWVMTGVYRAR